MATTDSDRSTIVGVFEFQSQAEQAVNDLRSAGFSDDQVTLAVHRAPGMGEDFIADEKRIEAGESGNIQAPGIFTGKPDVTRTVVTVKAEGEGRGQEALGILLHNGANNADIPEALRADLAPILGPQPVAPARHFHQPIEAGTWDSLLAPLGPGSPGYSESPQDVGDWDKPPAPDQPPRHPRPYEGGEE